MADESGETRELLCDAVARNVGLVLSLPSAGMWRHHKSRFLGECDEGIWVESAPRDAGLIDDLIGHQQPVAVSFKNSTGKTSFIAHLLKREANYRINAQITAEALLLRWPASVKNVQRRSDYRVRATGDSDIVARVWRIGEQADLKDVPMSCMEMPVELRDLSIGGMGMYVKKPEAGAAPLVHDARLRIELVHDGHQLILDGRLRHAPKNGPDTGSKLRVGVQFKELENDLNGRQTLTTLTRIVGHLQREEVRRARLGIAEAG
jgi:c-di-GMP-binding flagellar brake protein YcgR